MHPLTAFQQDVERLLDAAWPSEAPRPALEVPPGDGMGELGVPCFPLAKVLRKAPPAIAAELADAMDASGWVREVRAVGPYVNFFLDEARLASDVLGDLDAALEPAAKPGRLLLEHTSANPNGPLHVGRARNPILGDTLGRILKASGHEVETQYYMDNLGRQVAMLWKGTQDFTEADLEPAARDKPDHDLVRYYQACNARKEADPAYAEEIKELVARLETADADLLASVREAYEACFGGMRASLERLGVTYDSIKDESDLVAGGDVDETIERLKQSPRAGQEDDGANYLDLSAELEGNKSTKFFFTRKDQTSVYATRDVAYHKWKAEQVAPDGKLLNVLGEDHRLQSLQVSIALEELGHPRPEVVFYAFVGLPDGKMSTRANRVVFLDDLLDEAHALAAEAVRARRGDELDDAELDAIAEAVGVAAIRYNIAKVQPEKPIQFRWEEALDFDGDSAPYLMYAHARAASLLQKAAEDGLEAHLGPLGPGEARLAKVIARYVPEIEEAASRRAPHRFCAYATQLAGAFNEYYRDHPVLSCDDPQIAASRLAVVAAAKATLARALDALGIPALERM